MTLLEPLLSWLWHARPSDNPAVAQTARLLLLDTIGCAIAGFAEPEIQALAEALQRRDAGTVRLPGLPTLLSQSACTVVFAAASCWHEACEGHAGAHGRPGLHAIPAVLGPALVGGHSLRALLDSVVTGYEVGARLGAAWRIKPGLHVDGAWGTFGAAAAAARQAGLSADQAVEALDHAACHLPLSLYRPVALGSTARNAYVGHGAWLGTLAVAAAASGMGGPPGSIAEAYRLAMGTDLPAVGPPGDWMILGGYLKAFPAVKHVHYGVLAATRWPRAAPASIERVVLTIYPEALAYCGNRAPRTPIQAQFSLSFGLAWTLVHGGLAPAAYRHLGDPEVARIEALIELRTRPGTDRACTLEVTAAGQAWSTRVDTVPGDPADPLSPDAVAAKFRTYAAPVIGAPRADRLVARLLDGKLDAPFTLD